MKKKIRTARAYAMALAMATTISMMSCQTQNYSAEFALNNGQEQYNNRVKATRSSTATSSEVIFATIQTIISEKVAIPLSQIQLNSDIKKDLGMDSLDFVEIIMEIEKEFGINIPDDQAEQFIIVEDLVNYIAVQFDPQTPENPNAAIFAKIQEIILDKIEIPEGLVLNLQTNLRKDLGMDSLDFVEIIMEAEKEFGINIPDDQVEKMITVNDLVVYIAAQTEQQQPPVNPPVDPPVDPPIIDPDPPVDPPIIDPDPPVFPPVYPVNAEGWLKETLSARTGIPVSELNRATNLKDDLEMDDLDIFDFKTAVEANFGVLISDDRIQQLITIGDWITYIENRAPGSLHNTVLQ